MPRCNDRLRELRKLQGHTQKELADKAIVGHRTLQKAEAGKTIDLDTIQSLAAALEVDPDEIIDLECLDALTEGPFSFNRYVRSRLRPDRIAYCADEEDAAAAIVQMREGWQHHIARETLKSLSPTYRDGYELLLSISFEDYQRRYVELWKRHRSTVLFATRSGKRNGISVILPVSADAYEDLRRGKTTFLDVSPQRVQQRSQHLIIDSTVEFASTRTRRWYDLTDSLRFVVFFQIASLSFDAVDAGFRILSFGASPLNAQRLSANGFRELPTRMPDFQFPLYEFSQRSVEDIDLERTTFAHYARLLQRTFVHELRQSMRQAIMRRCLRAYQRLLERCPATDERGNVA